MNSFILGKKCPDEEERNQCYAKQVDKYRWMFEYALADGTGPAAKLKKTTHNAIKHFKFVTKLI